MPSGAITTLFLEHLLRVGKTISRNPESLSVPVRHSPWRNGLTCSRSHSRGQQSGLTPGHPDTSRSCGRWKK